MNSLCIAPYFMIDERPMSLSSHQRSLPPVASVPDRLHHDKKLFTSQPKYIHETNSHLVLVIAQRATFTDDRL